MIQRLEVRYRDSARDDLDAIFRFLISDGATVQTALGFVLRIEDRCQKIGNAPRGGRSRDDLYPGLRLVSFERSTAVAYLIEDDAVWIANIFYGGRDYETMLKG